MKNLLLALTLSITAISFAQTETYTLNTGKSIINWKGYYMFKIAEHIGEVKFKSGQLISQSGNITGGSFVIDMNTIDNEDNRERGHGPVRHLKDTDFFNVPKYPEAALKITKVEYFRDDNSHKFYADLTIKGITKPIYFIAFVDDVTKQIKTKFKIDRTVWGINYNNNLKDDSISDAIEFDVHLQF
ncbi:MAG: YceI family protein [Patiriisocius sp.]|uniref:YceI family protein n=1 Tax=Patiriisocius sp. TaxID=2822396 RepID=UPI003EF3D122